MWQQYKKTFVMTQGFIALVTLAVFAWSHVGAAALLFFMTMQLSSLIGASWATRLKSKFQ